MRLEKFKCLVHKVHYCRLESAKMGSKIFYSKAEIESWEDCKGDAIGDDVYSARVSAVERKRGRDKRKKYFNMNIYLTEDEFNNKVIEDGDIIEVTKGKLSTFATELEIRNKEKLKDFPKNKITKDERGFLIGKTKVTVCQIAVPIGGWQMSEKYGEFFYFSINGNRFYCDSQEELLEQSEFAFGLDEKEYQLMLPSNGKTETMTCYAHKQSKGKFNAQISVYQDEETQQYILDVIRGEKL